MRNCNVCLSVNWHSEKKTLPVICPETECVCNFYLLKFLENTEECNSCDNKSKCNYGVNLEELENNLDKYKNVRFDLIQNACRKEILAANEIFSKIRVEDDKIQDFNVY